jgi:lysophospholipase L1-like esterase
MKTIALLLPLSFMVLITACSKRPDYFRQVRIKTHTAVTPARIAFPEVQSWYWDRMEQVNKRLREGNVDILFVGNSITHGWESTGKTWWDQYFAPLNAVNMGFGWDWTQHTLWRLDHSDFSRITPKLAVVLIGTNNSNGDDCTAEEIADGMIAVCGRLNEHFPDMKILLLANFPRESGPCSQREKLKKANQLASRIANGKQNFYLDLSHLFLDQNLGMRTDLMPDCLHPNADGYRIWAKAMSPLILKLYQSG